MWSIKFIILSILPFCLTKSVDVTFKNVTFRGYSVFTEKFKVVIPTGNKLKDFLPTTTRIYDALEMKNQNIPVLYKDSLADLDNLDELVIEFCEVEVIKPGALSNVPMLRKLSLKGNNIKSIEFGVFNNLKVSSLDLSLNQIATINSRAFDDMPDLLNIQLADNNLEIWNPEWFKNTPLLTRLSVQNNSIQELPAEAFKNMRGIKKYGNLDLSINFVFSHNKISKIDPLAFSGLKKINNLWLDHNLLTDFSENLLDGIKVDDIRLNGNQIKCFEGNLDKVLKGATNHIDSNPFDCGCLEKIKEWSQKNKNVDYSYSEMECIAERIRTKMTALEKRLKELKESRQKDKEAEEDDDDTEPVDVEIFMPRKNSIK